MTFKPKQLVMKVRHPAFGKGHVPTRSVGEYLNFEPTKKGFPHRCHWPSMVGYKEKGNGSGNWYMAEGTIIPLNDPDFKGEDTEADVHSRREHRVIDWSKAKVVDWGKV